MTTHVIVADFDKGPLEREIIGTVFSCEEGNSCGDRNFRFFSRSVQSSVQTVEDIIGVINRCKVEARLKEYLGLRELCFSSTHNRLQLEVDNNVLGNLDPRTVGRGPGGRLSALDIVNWVLDCVAGRNRPEILTISDLRRLY